MASVLSIGEQWASLLSMLSGRKHHIPSNAEVSLKSLVWPLLPLLPPQPPPLLTELLRETDATTEEKCDLCGKTGKTFVKCCGLTSIVIQNNIPEAELRHRPVGQKRSSLDRMIEVIEDRVDEILDSIEQTTIRINELSRQEKNMYSSKKPAITDVELLNKLKTLVKQKETQGRRVKTLEIKNQKIEESLITAITWAKSLNIKGQNIPVNTDLPHTIQKQQTSDQQQDSTQEGINKVDNFLPTNENEITTDQQDIGEIEKDETSRQEEIDKEAKQSEITTDQQDIEDIEKVETSTQEAIDNEAKESEITTDQQDMEEIEKNKTLTPEEINKEHKESEIISDQNDIEEIEDENYDEKASVLEEVTEVSIDPQPLLEKGVSDVNVMLENVSQESESNNNVIIINHLSSLDEESSKKSIDTKASNMK